MKTSAWHEAQASRIASVLEDSPANHAGMSSDYLAWVAEDDVWYRQMIAHHHSQARIARSAATRPWLHPEPLDPPCPERFVLAP